MTIVETLVSSALFLLLGSLVITFFVGLTRSSLRGMAKGAAEQQTVIIFQQYLSDLQSSTGSALSWQPDVPPTHTRVLAIQPVDTVSSQGRLVYADTHLICYFWDPATRILRRKEWNVSPGVTLDRNIPRRLTGPQLEALRLDTVGTVKTYERVADFDLGNPVAAPNVGSPLSPTLMCLIETVQGGISTVDRYRLTRTVLLRDTQENAAPPYP